MTENNKKKTAGSNRRNVSWHISGWQVGFKESCLLTRLQLLRELSPCRDSLRLKLSTETKVNSQRELRY